MTKTSALGLGFRVYGLELRLRERLCNSPNKRDSAKPQHVEVRVLSVE